MDKINLELFLQIATIAGLIYRIAKAESSIYESIDKVKDKMTESLLKITASIEMITYRLDQFEKRVADDEVDLKIVARSLRENGIQVKSRKDDRG